MLSSKVSAPLCTSSGSRQVQALHRCRGSSSSSASQVTQRRQQQQQQQQWSPLAPAAAARQQQARVQQLLPRALKDEEAELDRITREASQTDIWGNELVGNLVKVGIVGAVVAAVVLIANLAQPLYDNTIKSFPTPAEYEQYEQRENEEGY